MNSIAKAAMLLAGAVTVGILPNSAIAQTKMIHGRTGLPTVRESKGNVWIEQGSVVLETQGPNLNVHQTFKLHYPSGKLEKGSDQIQVAVREDFFRTKDHGVDVHPQEAKGFHSFSVALDGHKQTVTTEPWSINKAKDTATRWRTWWVQFAPGKAHTMTISSVAQLGWDGGHRTVEFVAKDLGGWRDVPDLLEIKLKTPGISGT